MNDHLPTGLRPTTVIPPKPWDERVAEAKLAVQDAYDNLAEGWTLTVEWHEPGENEDGHVATLTWTGPDDQV